jgi:predicted nucleic acid-binding protein
LIPKVFLDANVLYSNTCRSLFIWLDTNGIVEISWSKEAWDEVFRNFAEKNDALTSTRFQSSMQKNAIGMFPRCMVSLPKFKRIGLRDKDDEHILAAAIQAGASYLLSNDEVLLNEKLPAACKIKLMRPDEFLVSVAMKRAPKGVLSAAESHRKSLIKSKPTQQEYIKSLHKAGLVKFSKAIS